MSDKPSDGSLNVEIDIDGSPPFMRVPVAMCCAHKPNGDACAIVADEQGRVIVSPESLRDALAAVGIQMDTHGRAMLASERDVSREVVVNLDEQYAVCPLKDGARETCRLDGEHCGKHVPDGCPLKTGCVMITGRMK